MYRIYKDFTFEASHQLEGLPNTHKCSRIRGHSYKVRLELASRELDETGFVIDYGKLNLLKQYINRTFDHKHLNDVLALEGRQTSAEILAEHFYRWCKTRWPQTSKVSISETPKCWASYSKE